MLKAISAGIVVSMCCAAAVHGQNQTDALRYSQSMPGSTARSSGVGGAFGAVGADMSSVTINPAGLAFYRSKQFVTSASFYNIRNNTLYNNSSASDNRFNFNLPNIGYVNSNINYQNGKEAKTGWINVTYALSLTRTNNFQRQTSYEGTNKLSSITQNFAERANGQDFNDFYTGSIEKLAWDTRVIDVDSFNVNQYVPGLRKRPYNVNQKGSILSRGAMNDYAFSLAGNFSHLFYLGGSVFISSVRYVEDNSFKETDKYDVTSKDIKSVSFTQYLKTSGTGIGARIGAIVRPTDNIRFGYSFQSPVSHALKDNYSYQIDGAFDQGASHVMGIISPTTATSGLQTYSYRILTPMKNTFSLALLDKKVGLFSADFEFVNYRQAKLSSQKVPGQTTAGYDFLDENTYIKTNYRSVVNIRAGTEIIAGIYRFRAGYAYYPSPFADGAIAFNNKLASQSMTFGFGIKDKTYALDIAVVRNKKADYYAPYTLADANNYYYVTNNIKALNVVITACFNLD